MLSGDNKIDFVVTWVDANDAKWQAEKAKYQNRKIDDDSPERYRDWGLFKYWFRCVEKNAPWVNNIFVITNGQIPDWLNIKNKKIHIVKHSDILPGNCLPTFNSNAIEFGIGRIKGLSENFVYFNDDMFVIKKTKPGDFFKNGLPRDTFGLDIIQGRDNGIGECVLNDMKIIQRLYPKQQLSLKNRLKLLSPKNGRALVKTAFLFFFRNYSSLYDTHSAVSYRKASFKKAYGLFGEEINNTCSNRFRTTSDIGIWTIRYMELVNGNFVPRNNYNYTRYLEPTTDNINRIICNVTKPKVKTLCINDCDACTAGYEDNKKMLLRAFDAAYPQKSMFEK